MHDKCMQKTPYEYQCPWPPRPVVGVSAASLTEPCRAAKGRRVTTQGLL